MPNRWPRRIAIALLALPLLAALLYLPPAQLPVLIVGETGTAVSPTMTAFNARSSTIPPSLALWPAML